MTQPIGMRGRPGGMRWPTTLLLVLAATLTACGAGQGGPSDAGASGGDVVGDWVLTGGSIDGEDAPVLPDHRITMTITGSQISGSAACNGYGGEISMGAEGLRLDDLAQTAMACVDPAAMAAEAAYMAALARIREIVPDGDELVARGDGVELRFAGLAPPPTSELVGTTWVLETVLVGDIAASAMGEPATLELNEDGTFRGSTGCRSFSGDWIEQGDQIQAPSWAMDDTTCPAELSDQDDHIVSVIGDGFIPTIDGELLTLMDPGGVGLVYRAED